MDSLTSSVSNDSSSSSDNPVPSSLIDNNSPVSRTEKNNEACELINCNSSLTKKTPATGRMRQSMIKKFDPSNKKLEIMPSKDEGESEHLPLWVKSLLPVYRYVKKEMENNKTKFHLACLLCEAADAATTPSADSEVLLIKNDDIKSNQAIIKDKQSNSFLRHLEVKFININHD